MTKALRLDPPLFVLSIEGLGSGRSATLPACILRWVTPLASKRTAPARAAQQLVPARPLVFGFALLRRACVCCNSNSAVPNIELLRPVARLTRRKSSALRELKNLLKQASLKTKDLSQTLSPRSLSGEKPANACEEIASRASVRALLASEAGRAARAVVAQQRNAKAPRVFCIRNLAMPNV